MKNPTGWVDPLGLANVPCQDADVNKKIEEIKKLRANNPEERLKQLAWDPDVRDYRMKEAQTAFDIEEDFGYFDRYERIDPNAPKGDFVSLSGPYKGKTFDDFGSEIKEGMIDMLIIKPGKTEKAFYKSLEKHLNETDYTVLNLSYLKERSNKVYLEVIDHIDKHPMKDKVINVTK